NVYTTPASAEQKPLSAYTCTRVRSTGRPIRCADCTLPPIAYTVRPKRVFAASSAPTATTSRAMSAPAEIEVRPPSGMRRLATATWNAWSMPIESTLTSVAAPRAEPGAQHRHRADRRQRMPAVVLDEAGQQHGAEGDHRAHRQVDAAGQDHEGHADRDDQQEAVVDQQVEEHLRAQETVVQHA